MHIEILINGNKKMSGMIVICITSVFLASSTAFLWACLMPAFEDTALVTAISLSAPFDFPLSDYTNNSCCHSMRVLSD